MVRLILGDPAWLAIAREVLAAEHLVWRYAAYGLNRASAGWVVEDHLRRAWAHFESVTERHVGSARTGLGRIWRTRGMRAYAERLREAIWYAQHMQASGEPIRPPALFFRDGTLPLLDQAVQIVALSTSTTPGSAGVRVAAAERAARRIWPSSRRRIRSARELRLAFR